MKLRGLTLWQPMAWAVKAGHKDIENRTWPPRGGVTHLAIHAGAKYHKPHADQIREILGLDVPTRSEAIQGAIIAVAKVVGCVEESTSRWFSGPFGWVLDEVQPLKRVIRRGGMLGLWKLSALDLESLRDQLPGLPWD